MRALIKGKWPALKQHFPAPLWSPPSTRPLILTHTLEHKCAGTAKQYIARLTAAILGTMSYPRTIQTSEQFDRAGIWTANPEIINLQPTPATEPQLPWRLENLQRTLDGRGRRWKFYMVRPPPWALNQQPVQLWSECVRICGSYSIPVRCNNGLCGTLARRELKKLQFWWNKIHEDVESLRRNKDLIGYFPQLNLLLKLLSVQVE